MYSEYYVPTERHMSPEALICLKCPLPEKKCHGNDNCERYLKEIKKLRSMEKKNAT